MVVLFFVILSSFPATIAPERSFPVRISSFTPELYFLEQYWESLLDHTSGASRANSAWMLFMAARFPSSFPCPANCNFLCANSPHNW